ncbi:MAG: hypothetical protein ACI9X4_000651 [Glaciecola sp.]|jgi:hypothetical protein
MENRGMIASGQNTRLTGSDTLLASGVWFGMHFELIRGGATPSLKTTNLSSPPRERLVPLRDLADLFGCSEPEIAIRAESLLLIPVPLIWRGMELFGLTLLDAFRLHLSMRTASEDSTDAADLRRIELSQALSRRERELAKTREEIQDFETREELREKEMKALMEGLGDLERTVIDRAGVYQDLAGMQKLYVESRAAQSALVLKLSQSQQDHREQADALFQAQARFDELQAQVESAEGALLDAKRVTQRLESAAAQSIASQAAELAAVQKHARVAAVALEAQADPKRIEVLSAARMRTAHKLRRMRRVYRMTFAVERNLVRYCNRLEEKLHDKA